MLLKRFAGLVFFLTTLVLTGCGRSNERIMPWDMPNTPLEYLLFYSDWILSGLAIVSMITAAFLYFMRGEEGLSRIALRVGVALVGILIVVRVVSAF